MKKQLLFAFLFVGSIFTASAQFETVPVTNRAFQGAYFGTAFNAGQLHGVLNSIDVNVTLTASSGDAYANDFSIVVSTGLTAEDVISLKVGGFSDFGALEDYPWPTGDSSTVGTVCSGTVILDTPLDFDANPLLKVYFGNGYAGTGSAGTWNGSFTLNGVSTQLGVARNTAASFQVFPNPANNVINVSNDQNVNVSQVTVTDLNGRIVKDAKYNNVSNVQLNVSDLSSGVYMMNISSDKGSSVQKIVKN